jgi:nitrogen regulatory protein PII-like uncharacterized protein
VPPFLIERTFAEELLIDDEAVGRVARINDDRGVRWLYSFLSANKRKTYRLYEAPDAELIREAARRANVPADVVVEVGEVRPDMFGRA